MKILRHKMSHHHGFSLVEVLVAVLIIGIGITGLVEGLSTAIYSHKDSEKISIAAWLAAERIEFIRADGLLIEGTSTGNWDGTFDGYTYSEIIEKSQMEGLYDISVIIKDRSEGKVLYSLKTKLFEAPLEVESFLSEEDEKERIKESERKGGNR